MVKILHIDASPRLERSHSRTLAREFIEAWKKAHPGDSVVYRDLGKKAPAPPSGEWIAAAYGFVEPDSPKTKALLRESDEIIDEFLAADRYVISAPMHNFNVSAALKAWIDALVRPTRTFEAGPSGLKGLVPAGRKGLVITARGGVYAPGSPWAAYDHQEPALRTALGFIGLTDLIFVNAEGINLGEEAKTKGIEGARKRLAELVKAW
jgi:FMN-dependent NADH-azoreductase